MRDLKALALGLFLALASVTGAFAQCGTTAPANKFCGNDTGSPALATYKSIPAGALTPIAGGTVLGNPTGALAVPIATTAPVLGIPGTSTGQVGLAGTTGGTAILRAQATAGSAVSLLPTAAGTLVGTATPPLTINATTGLLALPGLAGGVLAGAGPAFTLTPVLGVPTASQGTLGFAGITSGTATITAQATAGTPTLTLPNTSGTFAVGASAPLALNATTGALTCTTCATTTSGGAITGTAPITVSAAGVIALTTPLALNFGGTNASLTANNGGIVWSNTTQLQILAGTATARQMLQSGATATPAWSTTTWPATTTINRILWSSAANVISDLATANSSILVTSGGGVPSLSTTLPAHTLGGTISGGGNQINNVVIGATSPLAGSFTTINGSDDLTIVKAAGVLSEILTGSAGRVNVNYTGVGGPAWFLKDSSAGADLKFFNIDVASGIFGIKSLTDVGAVKFVFQTFDSSTNTVGFAGTVTNIINANSILSGFTGQNLNAGASAAVSSNFAITNAGTFRVAANSTAAGGFAILGWTGAGGTFIDQNNAAGNLTFRMGAGPTNTMYMTPAQNVVIGPNVFTPIASARLVVSNNTANAAANGPGENPMVQIVGADTVAPIMNITGFGAGASPILRFGLAGGTAASPTATTSGQTMVAFTAQGFYTSGGPAWGTGAGFVASSTENWTSTGNGTRVDIYAAPVGGLTSPVVAIAAGMSVGASGADPGAGAFLANASIKSQGATAGIGYATGAGGTVTQITSKATGVTLNKVTGTIVMNGAALAAGAIVSFAFTNSAVGANDQIVVTHESIGTLGGYTLNGRTTGVAGTANIDVRNNTAGSLSEGIILRYAIIKSVIN